MDLQWRYKTRVATKRLTATKGTSTLNDSMRLRLSSVEKEAFCAAAKKEGRGLSNWLRWVARRAAGLVEGA